MMNQMLSRFLPARPACMLAGIFFLAGGALAEPPAAPGTPIGNVSGSTVEITWAASSDDNAVAGYNVYQNENYITTVEQAAYSGILDPTRTQRFYVIAFDVADAGEVRQFSARSGTLVLGPPELPDTEKPTSPDSIEAVRVDDNSVNVSWSPAQDNTAVVGYNVYRNNVYLATVSGISLEDSGLDANTDYEYYVVAFDESRNFSPKSGIALATSTNPPVIVVDTIRPDRVNGLIATFANLERVEIEWTAGTDDTGVEGYNLYRDGDYFTTLSGTSFNDDSPPDADAVSYHVVAFDSARNFSVRSEPLHVLLITDEIVIPELPDPLAEPIASPPPEDLFGNFLELDDEPAVAGGPPSQPKHLRAELVSNDWAEINWAPSNDDGKVVEYRVYRNDGVSYLVNETLTSTNAGTQAELDKFWRNTSFIDCNYTRFSDRVHFCDDNGPAPGDEFIYEVSAVDDEGQESVRSEPLTITYHRERNAPVPLYDDIYLYGDDRFAQEHDLSQVRFFIDEFEQVFEDEFGGTQIDATHWQTTLTWGDARIINGEQQYFVNTQLQPDFPYDPFRLTGDSLVIEAARTPDAVKPLLPPICSEIDPLNKTRCQFLSGALSSHDRFGMTYGYVEARMKASGVSGALSSFYLYHRYPGIGINRHAPEIDILEYLGENPFGDEDAFQTYHYTTLDAGDYVNSAPTMKHQNPTGELYSEDFHTYGVLWEPQLVIWYIDGIEVKRLSGPQVARQQMNIVTYLVAGSAWAPTPDLVVGSVPLQFEIDYIKAWQRPPYNTNGIYPE